MLRLHLTATDVEDLRDGHTINAMLDDGTELRLNADSFDNAEDLETVAHGGAVILDEISPDDVEVTAESSEDRA